MKKGFTLVELLAVIVLLAILAIVAVPSAFKIAYNSKKNMYCEKVDMILQNAKSWGDDHSSQLKKTVTSNCYVTVTVDYLVEEGIIKRENETKGQYIVNPVTNNSMDDIKIGLYLKNNRAYAFYIETDDELKDACETLRVCNSGEDETADNCTKRPTSECA